MRRLYLLAGVVALLVFPAAVSAAPPVFGQVSEYQLGVGTRPTSLVAGPDGNLWFAGVRYVSGGFADVVGKVTPRGNATEFELGTHSANVGLGDLTVGPDGNLWFTEGGRSGIGRITPDGAVTRFALPPGAGSATSIAAGPDGNLWFTESGAARVGRITPAGEVTEFPLVGAREFWGGGIVAGPDGALWVTLPGAGAIARIGTDGSETDFPLPGEAPAGYPNAIVAGPDGALWFGRSQAATLGRISTSGEVTELPIPQGQTISALASGPFDDLWYSNGGGRIGWVVPGVAQGTTACINSCASPVTALAEGPEGKLWFTAGVESGMLYTTPGTIGTYAPPPLEVRVVGEVEVEGERVRLPVRCRLTPAGRRCKGRVRLSARLPGSSRPQVIAAADLGLRLGARRAVTLRLGSAREALDRTGRLRVRVTTTVRGGRRDIRTVVLRRG
jgi:streptogramin lyase